MKSIFLASLLFLSGCHSFDRISGIGNDNRGEALRVFVMGQSNASSGWQGTVKSIYSTTGRVYTRDAAFSEPDFWIPTVDKPARTNISFIVMGDILVDHLQRSVYVRNVSMGATSSVRMWNDNREQIISAVKEFNPHIIIDVQGESDYMERIDENTTYDYKKRIFLAVKSAAPQAKLYCALTSNYDVCNPVNESSPRVAQQRLINEGIALKGVNLDEMRCQHPEWFESSGFEAISDGLIEHGKLWAKILLQ